MIDKVRKFAKKYVIKPVTHMPYGYCVIPPLKITYEVTYKCNLRCKTCPWWREDVTQTNLNKIKERQELSTTEVKKAVDSIKKIGIRDFHLTGGEPFIRQDITEIINYIKKKGFHLRITNNGTCITQEHIENLVNNNVDFLTFSLDGTKDIHDNIRGLPGTYDKVEKACLALAKYKKEKRKKLPIVHINFTLSSENEAELFSMVGIAKELHADILNIQNPMFSYKGAGEHTDEILKKKGITTAKEDICMDLGLAEEILPKHIGGLYDSFQKVKKEGVLNGVKVYITPNFKSQEELEQHYRDVNKPFSKNCLYPWYEMRMDPFGDLYICILKIKVGNILKDDLKKVWNGEDYKKFRTVISNGLLPICTKCCKLNNQ